MPFGISIREIDAKVYLTDDINDSDRDFQKLGNMWHRRIFDTVFKRDFWKNPK